MGSATKVELSSDADVVKFRKQVKAKNTRRITVDARVLTVYSNRTEYENKDTPLKSSVLVAGLGKSLEDALVVVVPASKTRGIIMGN